MNFPYGKDIEVEAHESPNFAEAAATIPSECKQVLRIEFSIPRCVGDPRRTPVCDFFDGGRGVWTTVTTLPLHFELLTENFLVN